MRKFAVLFFVLFMFVALTCVFWPVCIAFNGDKPVENGDKPIENMIYEWGQLTYHPSALTHTSPEYPESLRRLDIAGNVFIGIIIEKTGQVDSVWISESSGNVIIDSIFIEVAKTFVFDIPKVNDDSVRATVTIPFSFDLIRE